MIVTKTPFRLSLFGGGTDYNSWFEKKGGLVIGSTFSKYCYISIRKLPPFFDHKTRIVYSKVENVNHHSEIQHPAIRACLEYMNISDGLEIHYDGDLPARSGIGSSSSFTVAFLQALNALKNNLMSKMDLAKEAIHLEQTVLNENVGIQDQILATYGGLRVIEMGPGKDYNVTRLILPQDYKDHLESHVMLAFSGIQRFSSDMAKSQVKEIENGSIDQKMTEIHDIAREALSLFKDNADIDKFGKLLNDTWQIKRTLTNDISNDSIDSIYQVARNAGAYGGRLLGAGGGGFLMFLAPPEAHEKIKEALKDAIKVWVPFSFENNGSQIIHYDE